MRSIVRCVVPIIVIGCVCLAVASLAGIDTTRTGFYPLGVASASVGMGLAAGIRQWQKIPFGAFFGVAIASIGYLMNVSSVMMTGFFVFIVLTVWQEHQVEKKLRVTAS